MYSLIIGFIDGEVAADRVLESTDEALKQDFAPSGVVDLPRCCWTFPGAFGSSCPTSPKCSGRDPETLNRNARGIFSQRPQSGHTGSGQIEIVFDDDLNEDLINLHHPAALYEELRVRDDELADALGRR